MTTNLIMRDWMVITRTCSQMIDFRIQLLNNLSNTQFDYLMKIEIVGHVY